jgi:hypothetical protein
LAIPLERLCAPPKLPRYWRSASATYRGAQGGANAAEAIEPGGELVLGKAGTAGGRDGAHVDQELHPRLLEFVEHGLGGRLFVADGEELFGFGYLISGYFTRAINSTDSKPGRRAYGQS